MCMSGHTTKATIHRRVLAPSPCCPFPRRVSKFVQICNPQHLATLPTTTPYPPDNPWVITPDMMAALFGVLDAGLLACVLCCGVLSCGVVWCAVVYFEAWCGVLA